MAKNLIPEICKLLGVEVGEKFRIKDVHSDYISSVYYSIDSSGRLNVSNNDGGCWRSTISLEAFLTGEYEIVKLLWKPKREETYFSLTFSVADDKLHVTKRSWRNRDIDHLARFKAGWVYRTREEAEAALPKVAKELGVEYEI